MKKKILSILLSISMLTAMAVPAMAEESAAEETVTTELFAEDFEGDNLVSATAGEGTWLLSKSGVGFSQDSTIFHGGEKSLKHSGTKGSVKYQGTKSVGNYVYEFWYYDNGGTGAALVDLSGTDENGKEVTKELVFGVKTATSEKAKNCYMVCSTSAASDIQRSVGWHHVVIDTTVNGKVTVYLDGNNIYDNTTTVYNVTDVRFIDGWQQDSNKFNIDDMKAYESYADVPVYRKNVMESIKFASGVDVEWADNAVTADGDITITFKENMVTPTQENFTLLARAATSTSDADYDTATVTLKAATETSATLSIEGLKADTEYRLGFTGLTTADEKTVATDFIEFSTAADVALERSVVDYVAFDNGARLPSTGIPETFGDLIVHFTEEMAPETLNKDTVILTKEDETVEGGVVDMGVSGIPSEDTYIIHPADMNLEPLTTYTLTVTTGAKTETENHACEDYSVTFTTSTDLEHQNVIFEDSFENGWGNWDNRGGHSTTDATYHTGTKALSLSKGGYVQYNGPVPTNAVYEVWIYDGGLDSENTVLVLSGETADGTTGTIQFGTKNDYPSQYWLSDGSTVKVGTRSVGWHRFIIDFRNPDEVDYYIDDELVVTRAESIKKITDVRIRNVYSTGKMIADDFKIWNAVDYDVISKVYESKAFICDENYNALVDYKAGDEVYVAVNIDNQQAASQDAVLIVAEYDKNGALSKVKSSEKTTIKSGENVKLRVEYTIPENFNDYELKAFVWDSLDTIKPIMPASDPKEVTAVFLGGSITAGTKASEVSKNYVSQTGEYLKATYGSGSDVTIVNSGVGGTGSAFGAKYFDNYVGRYNPDILFVEYAVNDRGGVEADVKKTLEQVVQKALALPKKPKIVFIYTTTEKLDSCAAWHGAVAQYYGIPEINLEEAVKTEIIGDTDATTWTNWETHLDDGVHPNDTGYKFYADNIIEALKGEGFLKTAEVKDPYFQQ